MHRTQKRTQRIASTRTSSTPLPKRTSHSKPTKRYLSTSNPPSQFSALSIPQHPTHGIQSSRLQPNRASSQSQSAPPPSFLATAFTHSPPHSLATSHVLSSTNVTMSRQMTNFMRNGSNLNTLWSPSFPFLSSFTSSYSPTSALGSQFNTIQTKSKLHFASKKSEAEDTPKVKKTKTKKSAPESDSSNALDPDGMGLTDAELAAEIAKLQAELAQFESTTSPEEMNAILSQLSTEEGSDGVSADGGSKKTKKSTKSKKASDSETEPAVKKPRATKKSSKAAKIEAEAQEEEGEENPEERQELEDDGSSSQVLVKKSKVSVQETALSDETGPKKTVSRKKKVQDAAEGGEDGEGGEEVVAKPKKTKKAAPAAAAAGVAASSDIMGYQDSKTESGVLSQTVTLDVLQGAKVKRNSAAAQRAKLAAAATLAAQNATLAAEQAQDDSHQSSFPDIETIPPPDTVVVNSVESAQRVLAILNRPDVKKKFHACDTETTGIDPKIQSPVGNGTVICASIYVGPDVDFGGGSRIWIDNYGKASGTLDLFKEYFEDVEIKKVWHNYSFDRHILYNHGINCVGFGGDTMHMARLWNSGRTGEGANYGLESLTKDLVTEIPGKESMTTRFGHKKILKNGEEGKVTVVPGTLELQLDESTRTEWIDYSVRDAQATWYLRERLQRELEQWPWTGAMTMMEFYKRYWLPFGELLTDMERVGIHVRRNDYLPEIRKVAEADRVACEEKFMNWAKKVKPECQYMNASSEQQKQQLFFGPVDENDKNRSGLPVSREFETENTWGYIEPGKAKPKKNFKFSITGLGLPVLARTPLGKPQINMQVLKELAGNPFGKKPSYGKAFEFFGGGDSGREACEAMYQLIKLAGIEITISTFIDPLTVMPDQNDRVHCSLNLNTETGRLSARKPNLQNQPSMDKDVYKIRHAFSAEKGNKLIVSDYGQLELRVLAHITKCKSMIEAFELGGDFHSRTAMGMYQEVADAVKNGDVLLEWDWSKGEPPKPLLKDKYGNERKKAKILNFSIAYGKTVRGLAQDFGVPVAEAQKTVDAWYGDRPEVLEWQQRTIAEARRTGVTRTMMGRYRPLHGINDPKPFMRGHAERMAINTPVQGGAADLVAAAMLKLHHNEEFKELGYKIILQVHDELIVEGPEKNVTRAHELVKECMEKPFKNDLLVKLVVDSNIADTWYEGK